MNDKKAKPAKAAPAKVAKVKDVDGKTVIRPDTESYVAGVSGSGKKTQHCGDEVAAALNGLPLTAVAAIAVSLTGTPDLAFKYDHLNIGQQRMNLGNRIRGVVKAKEKEAAGSGIRALNAATAKYAKQRASAPAPKAKKAA